MGLPSEASQETPLPNITFVIFPTWALALGSILSMLEGASRHALAEPACVWEMCAMRFRSSSHPDLMPGVRDFMSEPSARERSHSGSILD